LITEKIVAHKSRIGDWESDRVIGKNHKGAIVTLTKIASNYLLIKKIENKTADLTSQGIIEMFKKAKLHLHTITFDNRTEFADFKHIEKDLKVKTYFAHPFLLILTTLGSGVPMKTTINYSDNMYPKKWIFSL
jgi:IS30 family transposase